MLTSKDGANPCLRPQPTAPRGAAPLPPPSCTAYQWDQGAGRGESTDLIGFEAPSITTALPHAPPCLYAHQKLVRH